MNLAETTPVLEAAALQADLRRAGIEPWGWVINNSLAAAAATAPLLRRRAAQEWPRLEECASAMPSVSPSRLCRPTSPSARLRALVR